MTQDILLLDGGTGRELMRLGAPFRQPEWSALSLMEAPEFVSQVHQRYIAAGADIITSNSYAVVPFHIGADRFGHRGAELAALAGQLARKAADASARRVRVAGSLPPVCGSYRPDLFDAAVARPVLQTLISALDPYVDLWLSETLSSQAEMQLVGELLGRSTHPWWVSYTLRDEHRDDLRPALRSGEDAGHAARHALELGAQAVLFNCCQPEVIGPALQRARQQAPVAQLGAYANAFPPQSADASANEGLSTVRADLDPEAYLTWTRHWLAQGATIVGGCCGVGPEHIALMRQAIDRI